MCETVSQVKAVEVSVSDLKGVKLLLVPYKLDAIGHLISLLQCSILLEFENCMAVKRLIKAIKDKLPEVHLAGQPKIWSELYGDFPPYPSKSYTELVEKGPFSVINEADFEVVFDTKIGIRVSQENLKSFLERLIELLPSSSREILKPLADAI